MKNGIWLSISLGLVMGCAQTLQYAEDTASHRAGTGVGQVVGDKAVSEVSGAVNGRTAQPRSGPAGGGSVVVAGGAGGGSACSRDPHCLLPDDVLVCDPEVEYYRQNTFCAATHAITPPSAGTKRQGQFLLKANGKEFWSQGWVKTRPVHDGENLRIGQELLYLEGQQGPATHDDLLKVLWRIGKVTDLSDGFKGQFRSSLGHSVHISLARVIVESGRADPKR